MTLFRSVFMAAALWALAACASAPVRYHTLSPAEAVAPPPAVVRGRALRIEVLPVGIPAQLDQQPLVLRQGSGAVAVAEGDRWAGPLGDELRAALSTALTRRLGAQDVAGLPGTQADPVLRIKVQVRRLDAWLGQRAALDADWSLAQSTGGARLTCNTQLELPAPGGIDALVEAQQRLVAGLADAIAAQARRFDEPGAACAPTVPAP